MNRRDFLHPRRLAHTAGQILVALDDVPQDETYREEASLLRLSRCAMATSFEIVLPYGIPNVLEAAKAGLDLIDRLEDQLTVYKETSEVSRLNRLAAAEAVPVSEGLYRLLALAARITAETAGAFDITAGALIKAWGFYRRSGRLPAEEDRERARACTGMHHVVLDPESRRVRYLRPGLEINLGSIGKGYALDRVAELLRNDWNLSSALLHGGHSSVYAIGSEPGKNRGWAVGIRHPWEPQRRLAIVHLRDRALATSAATFQNLEYNGRKLGHILDPRSGWPAEALASATVLAPTASEADALATAFFILGVEPARLYCETHPEIGAVLLPAGEDAELCEIGLNAQGCTE